MASRDGNLGLEVELPYWVQQDFRTRVAGLLAVTYSVAIAAYLTGFPPWVVVFGMPTYILAAIATYYQLRENGRSGWWIILMIGNFGFGPKFLGLPILGIAMNMVPVIMAWRTIEGSGDTADLG
ncbi:hypothetical protein Ga0102493_11216 [Erythrobacter litoralis]|jgi:hypothetical protein|uniref:Uncharacterized protein n=1 Tax=Erythrobacter litoralis TaxID=39960 RepID=A0A074MNH2_9SPHN|nr:hypothetical protein [Erythrobacter litoralis]AOL24359.1 hypothetical protein Ga0102493_11216 [Erythrobacter litoralis]KEO93398.1 hypothetical protein EH32_11825 [Erythrobacter litoralis]MEE4339554.1 hypothetical protein [Erythrobacter sp.]